MQVHCPYCGTVNSSSRRGVPVSQGVSEESNHQTVVLMLALGGAGLFMLLMLVVGVVAWYSLQSNQQVAQQHININDDVEVAPSGEIERPKVLPDQPVYRRLKSNDRPAKPELKSMLEPEPEVDKGTADPTKRSIATGKMKPAFRYGFTKDNRLSLIHI